MANEYTLGGPPPQSRSEKILMNQNPGPAQSRIEELLKNASSGRTAGALVYKGTVETALSLPSSGNEVGDVYHVNSDGSEWAWNGSAWEELGKSIATDAVLYTPQTMTDAQKEQARGNIGAIDYSSLNAVVPEQYGAVGDGETDDTTAVRAALKASIDTGKTLFLPKKYYVTESLLTSTDYSTCTLKIEGASPSNREQYSVGAFGGIKFANGLNLFDGLTVRGSMHCVTFMPVSRTQTGSIFYNCILSKFTFDSCFVSNLLAFCHNTNVTSTSRIKDSTFLTVYYFAKCDAGNKYCTDSTIQNCYINGGSEMNDNNCFEWYNWNGSNVTGNFVDYYRIIYRPVLSGSGQFQAPVSSNNQYQVFRYFYFVSNVTSFQFQSEADCFNWNDPSASQKLTDYVPLTYTGRDSVVRDIPPYILLVTEEGAVEINNAVIHNNIGNIVFVRRGLGNYSFSRAKLTCSLRDHRRSYDSSVQVADSIYGAGTYRDNLIDIPFAKPVDSLPSIGLTWSINYPGMRVRYNNRTYRYMWLYDGNSWVATWVDEAIGAYKTSMLINDSGYQTAAQVQTAIAGKADKMLRIAMTAQDTTPALDPNKLYVFPEMASLTPTFATPSDATIANEYRFVFDSGSTATVLTLPASVLQPDGFTVEANMHYEILILEGAMTAQGWAVSA